MLFHSVRKCVNSNATATLSILHTYLQTRLMHTGASVCLQQTVRDPVQIPITPNVRHYCQAKQSHCQHSGS